jgi:hypothetical protein
MVPYGRKFSDDRQRVRSGELSCTHEYPLLVTNTETGYYARCLRCLTAGPECRSTKAARRTLLMLAARDMPDLRG